jgi:polyphosphate kinase
LGKKNKERQNKKNNSSKRFKIIHIVSQIKYIDREKSWLAFNARVLQEAADESVPL